MRRAFLVGLVSAAWAMTGAGAWPASGQAPGQSDTRPATARVKLFFVAIEDGGRSGPKIGCNDSIIGVDRVVPANDAPWTAAVGELLDIRERNYGQSGLYNALAQSSLTLASVSLSGATPEVRLTGTIKLGGTCDAPRVDAQLRQTLMQFPALSRVAIFVNDVPIERVLSGQ